MQTQSLISLAKKQFPDWSREMLLEFLNELQRIIFTQSPTNQMKMYDSSTGKDPILTTTSGQYEYTIDSTNGFDTEIWRVVSVYINEEEPIECMILDTTPSSSAKVIFKENPSSQDYYVRCYRFPVELVTENIQLEVPDAYHLSHVYEGLCGLIEKFRSGKSDRYDGTFMQTLLPELLKKMSDNHTRVANTKYRGY